MTAGATLTRPETSNNDTGDKDPAHLIDKSIPGNDIEEAMVFGTEIEALCGFRWIPYRDPQNRPICEPCKEEYERRINA